MQVVKVEVEGVTTSFRYPHFLVGRQPSLPLPPPATIYGHIASALGYLPNREEVQFGYSFVHSGLADDQESRHIVKYGRGKFAGQSKNTETESFPVPGLRQLLVWPQLTLYIASSVNLDIYYRAFSQPKYAVVLGRSQDLATYLSVELVNLEKRDSGYFEGSLLPNSYRDYTNAGILIQMPRFINPDNRRLVEWEMYLAIEGVSFTHPNLDAALRSSQIWEGSDPEGFWIDPTSTVKDNRQRIVFMHNLSAT